MNKFFSVAAAASLVLPGITQAYTPLETPAVLMNTFLGLYITIILLTLIGGLVMYFGRMGTWPSNRDEAIKILEWAVVMMFTLVIVVAAAQFLEKYPTLAMRGLGILAALALVYVLLMLVVPAEEAHDGKDGKKPAAH